MPRSRKVSNQQVAPLELENLDRPIERHPITPAKELLGTGEKSLLGNYDTIAAPAGEATAEDVALSRGATPDAIQREIDATERFRPTPLQDISLDNQGDVSPRTLSDSVNTRLSELHGQTPQTQSGYHHTDLVSSAKEKDGITPLAKPINTTGAEALLSEGTELIKELWSDDNNITYKDEEGDEVIPIRNFVTTSLGNGVKPRMAGTALIAGMLTSLSHPALLALQKRPGDQKDTKEALVNQLNMKSAKIDDPNNPGKKKRIQKVGEVRDIAFPYDEQTGELGKLDPQAFSILFAAFGRGVENAREILGVEEATPTPYIDPEEDGDQYQQLNQGSREGDPETGEAVAQYLMDKGLISILGYKDPATGRMRYYPAVTPAGEKYLKTARSIEEATAPGKSQQRKMSRVPTDWRATVGQQPKDKTEAKRMLEEDAPTADQIYIAILGGVPLEVDTTLLEIFKQVVGMYGKHDIVNKYFKLDKVNLDETYDKVRETETNKMRHELQGKVEAGFMSPQEAHELSQDYGEQQANEHLDRLRKQESRRRENEIEMLQAIATDPEGGIRYIEYGMGRNKRVQAQSRDGQMESKAIIRAILGFAEKSTISRDRDNSPEALAKDAQKVFDNIFKSKGLSRDGWEVLDGWDKMDQQELEAIQLNAIFARAHIMMFKNHDGVKDWYQSKVRNKGARNDGYRPLNLRRMTPPDYLDYFAQNRDQIMADLADAGRAVQSWAVNGVDPNSQYFNPPKGKNFGLLKRGEAGFLMATVLDAANYVDGVEPTFQSIARLDIDSNNSNVGLHGLKSGNLESLGTLGFIIGLDDVDPWFDTSENPDSFYDVLAYQFDASVDELYEGDEDMANTLKDFFASTIGKEKNWKDWSRALVVHGFYGLHPIVNTDAIKSLMAEYPDEFEILQLEFGGDRDKMFNALKAIRGHSYDTILGNVSQTKIMNNSMAALTMFGDQAPVIVTDTNDTIRTGIGELMPSYLKETVFDGTGLKAAPDVNVIQDRDGNLRTEIRRKQRYDYEIGRGHFTEDGTYKDLSKPNGMAIGDSASATITHSTDAAAEKIAIIAQNIHRARRDQQPMPNIPIHDANILNSKSWFQHWTAYNMIALPALAAERATFIQVYDAAIDMHGDLKKYSITKRKRGEQINVGVGPGSRHRTIFGVLDYWDNRINGKGLGVPQSEEQKLRSKKQEAQYKKLLESAENAGWVPKHSQGSRDTVLVDPDNFMHLVNIAYHFLQLRDMDPSKKTPLQRKIQTIMSQQEVMMDNIEAGRFISNTQN